MQIKDEIVKRIYPKSTILKYTKKNNYLNNLDTNYVTNFLFIKLFASILLFFISFILNRNLIISTSIIIVFNIAYNYYKFENKLNIRQKQLEKDAGLFFEILVLSLKSGKNLDESLKLTVNNLDNLLSNEVKSVLDETNYGRSLIEALEIYNTKVPSENINNIFNSIIESYISGKNMITSIEKEKNLLATKRIYDIKKYINKLPIKISIISVFILIPLMLLIILSPVILDLLS